MKKVCFVIMGNIYMAPYLSTYAKHIEGPYSVIYWDREGRGEDPGANTYFRFAEKLEGGKLKKIMGYFRFRRYAGKVLKNNDFDVVILLQTWCALILSGILRRKYSRRYVIDVRDYTYEKNPMIYHIEKKVIGKSLRTVISSEGYKKFLPPYDYLIAHNMRNLPADRVWKIQHRDTRRDILHIAFIGYVNYQEQHKKLILALKDDSRFRLSFIGTKAEELGTFCREHNVENVTLRGTFEADRILDFYRDVDMVNNLYGNHTPVLDYALSNKLYFAATLQIPILVYPDTYMAEVSDQFGIGCKVSLDESDIGDKLFSYYQNMDWPGFQKGCGLLMEKAESEQAEFERVMANILK